MMNYCSLLLSQMKNLSLGIYWGYTYIPALPASIRHILHMVISVFALYVTEVSEVLLMGDHSFPDLESS